MDAGPSHSQRIYLMDVQEMSGQTSEPHERQPAGWPLPSPPWMQDTGC